ncbi:hypothetical protein GCM10025868_36200 [Angustibacter aerolatus]|uniref:Dehydrogenase E1 component domain-containing protein n=1 Tax=Angustibacter aerolatus TaxID=1162965 RepID=A0ABQ6JM99_9ACTN|nr:thiamine pyrophosphate-dependent dehydrogenase E1 component subunit alpha [Angustibacter aerolatus]GMA88370.1 hypothetical protein GCM10025868_36200 [Angustibacter aerolatus]
MTEHRRLDPEAPWVELVVTDEDWDAAEPHLLTSMLSQAGAAAGVRGAWCSRLAGEGLVHGPAHSSIGQEGGAVGSVLTLTSRDTVNGSHRGHHQFLAKVLHHLEPKGIDPLQPWSPEVRAVLLRSLAEIAGLDRGFSHGRGGSMHLQWKEAGAIGTNAIVGGGVPLAVGSGWAHRHAQTDAVAVTYFGDGAANIGSTLESFNLAAAWKVPVCFFVENNQYAVSTSVHEATAEPRLSARGPGFGIPSWRVDGMDPLAVHLAMSEAVQHMRSGRGATLVEVEVYRYFHQNGPFPGSAFRYRSKEEERAWRDRDPSTASSATWTAGDPRRRRGGGDPRARRPADGRPRRRACSSRCRAASPASAASRPPSGPTRRSSTSACAATWLSSPTRGSATRRRSRAGSGRCGSSTPSPT